MHLLKKLRPVIGVILLLAALIAGGWYLASHHNLVHELGQTHWTVLVSVFGLYIVIFGVLMLILSATLSLCAKRLPLLENAQLNVSTLLINFFVPGQGGPAYRGAYLYKRHQLRIKSYIKVTLLYYLFYAIVSAALLLVTRLAVWQTIGALIILTALGVTVVIEYWKKNQTTTTKLQPLGLSFLLLATILQATVQLVIYAIELRSVNHHIALSQIVTYTGAANLTLFVALTPGAIGIRESFLIFTEHLHRISSANIILANVIDRSVYLVFLLGLIVISLIWQFNRKLGTSRRGSVSQPS